MKIIVGKTAGFCYGVLNAVNKAKESLKKEKVCCLGELVHNNEVNQELKEAGIEFIDTIEQATKKVIIRSHGENINTYKKAKEKNIDIIDLTCPNVLKIHNIVTEYSKNGYYIFLVGKKTHPETMATISYCGENSIIIEDTINIEEALQKLKETKINNLLLITQTTYNLEKFNNIVNYVKSKIDNKINLEIKNTICNTTKLRQEETKELSKKVDAMIIIGGKHSSNTVKLYEISKENCKDTILIETKDEIDINNLKNINSIGIMAGASTPQRSIDSVVELLKKI